MTTFAINMHELGEKESPRWRCSVAFRITLVATLSLVLLAEGAARAQTAPAPLRPITDRNYTVDLHEGVIFGSPRLVAMGGAAFAIGEGATGLFTNAASGAVRPTKPTDNFEWSAFLNSYIPASGVDFNNNGDPTNEYRRSAVYAPGLLVQFGSWQAPFIVAASLLIVGAAIWGFWLDPSTSVVEKKIA